MKRIKRKMCGRESNNEENLKAGKKQKKKWFGDLEFKSCRM